MMFRLPTLQRKGTLLEHLDAIHHILWYLTTSLGLGLFFTTGSQFGLFYFIDANFARCRTDRCSTSSFCTFYGDHLISWKSKNQVIVSRSSAKVEYRTMTQGTCEILRVYLYQDFFFLPFILISNLFGCN